MRFQTIIISAILILVALIACRDKVTQPYIKSIWLSAEDIGVTDAFIHIILSNDTKSSNFSLKLNGKTIFNASARDTLIFSDSLLPKHTYTYRAYRLNGAIVFDSSDALTISTLDTTSHNFTWEIDTLGDGNSSVLYDVAIINDTLAYAVGEIYKKDSTEQFETEFYNIAKWNGSAWKFERIYYPYQGQNYIAPLHSIYAFSKNDIWVGSNQPMHWNGSEWRTFDLLSSVWNGWINKIWGTSSTNIYIVGNQGAIAFFNGSSWQKIESRTTTDIMDAWGIFNPTTNRTEVYCAVTSFWTPQDKKILKIVSSSTVDSVAWTTGRDVVSIWTPNGFPLFTAGDGVFENKTGRWREMDVGANIYTQRIRGNSRNDIIAIGGFELIAHYNGLSWRVIQLNMSSTVGYPGLAVSDRLVVVVGGDISRAIVSIGKR